MLITAWDSGSLKIFFRTVFHHRGGGGTWVVLKIKMHCFYMWEQIVLVSPYVLREPTQVLSTYFRGHSVRSTNDHWVFEMLDWNSIIERDHLQVSHVREKGSRAQLEEVTWSKSESWLETKSVVEPGHLVSWFQSVSKWPWSLQPLMK